MILSDQIIANIIPIIRGMRVLTLAANPIYLDKEANSKDNSDTAIRIRLNCPCYQLFRFVRIHRRFFWNAFPAPMMSSDFEHINLLQKLV